MNGTKQVLKVRKEDGRPGAKHFRSGSRLFVDNGLWCFETRENRIKGPYQDRRKAEQALSEYINMMKSPFATTQSFGLVADENHPEK